MNLLPSTWIDNTLALQQLLTLLHQQRIIAVDTESDSLHSYFSKVCLVQLSIQREGHIQDYIIDPLAVDILPLSDIFASSNIQKIFHAAEYDVMSLRRDYGFSFDHIFDTMLAAQTLGWPKCGLGDILETHFNIKLDKRFQRHNWGERPLGAEALQYARIDTHYLFSLRNLQQQALDQRGLLQRAKMAFNQVAQAKMRPKVFRPVHCKRVKGFGNLTRQQQAHLRNLYIYRDEMARWINKPAFKVIHDSILYQIARQSPQTLAKLKRIKGINSKLLNTYGHNIVALLQDSQFDP